MILMIIATIASYRAVVNIILFVIEQLYFFPFRFRAI